MATFRSRAMPRTTPHPAVPFSAWRLVSAVPAMIGSAGVLLVLSGWMGRGQGPALLAWLATGVVAMTPRGERFVARLGLGVRRPAPAQLASLDPLWSRALSRCAIEPANVDLYLLRASEPNAFVAGRRSVALTTGVVSEHQAGRLTDDHVVAILIHELGHHATRATRFAIVTAWLAGPWRLAARVMRHTVVAVGGRRRFGPSSVVAAVGVAVAVIGAMQRGEGSVAVVLGVASVAIVLCPLADAALRRSSEFAADRFAAMAGFGPDLCSALLILGNRRTDRRSVAHRLLSRHPSTARRVVALDGAIGPPVSRRTAARAAEPARG